MEYCVQEDDGAIRWVQKTALMTQTTVFDPEINAEMPMVTAIILLQDTSQMRRERAGRTALCRPLVEMRIANRTKTKFCCASHDIHTPLNGIIGLLRVDETHFDDKALLLENHKKMQISAKLTCCRSSTMCCDEQAGGRPSSRTAHQSGGADHVIITVLIGRAEEVEALSGSTKRTKSVIPYPYIYGSPLHLRQIFLNIYSNCIKYNRPGPHYKSPPLTDSLGEQDGKCTYRWTISDTGIGMSRTDHIFEPFTQEKQDAQLLPSRHRSRHDHHQGACRPDGRLDCGHESAWCRLHLCNHFAV